MQTILRASEKYEEFDEYIDKKGIHSLFLVCDGSLEYLRLNHYMDGLKDRMGIDVVRFSDFLPNPKYESVVKGVGLFRKSGCDSIIAIGGGSAIDVAKCIKLYASSEGDGKDGAYLRQPVIGNEIGLLAVPTTAGTGSEATRYAVVYYKGEKQSVTHDSIIPEAVLFDPSALTSLPAYQKKSTVLDALCHAIESFWSVNSTDESKAYARQSIEMISGNIDEYLAGNERSYPVMQKAAFTAGKAINITQTTAGHAMCYGLTSRYGISHGHAAALCVRELWPQMLEASADVCMDERGGKYLKGIFGEIADSFGEDTSENGYRKYQNMLESLELMRPIGSEEDIEELVQTVNITRLLNHPIRLAEADIRRLYKRIVRQV